MEPAFQKLNAIGSDGLSTSADSLIGTVLSDRYEIVSLIGKGGFGLVFRAKHLALGQDIAIKVIRGGILEEAQNRRFEQEAIALSKIDSPSVVRIIDYATTPFSFIVMEYFEGVELKNSIANKEVLSLHETLDIFIQVCDGLAAAHALGFVHRDLKPANILKTQRLTLARNLDEFVHFGVQTPLAIRAGSAPPELDEIIKSGSGKLEKPEFTPRAGSVLQKGLALSVLKELAGNQQLPGNLRNNVAWTSWVRAVLIGDDAAAHELAQIARPLNKKKVKLFDTYLAAATPDARKFAAVFLMLHFSSAQPNASWGLLDEDGYGDASGWWWDAGPVAADMHFLVKATRYGSADETTRVFSRQAFTLLHTKYKTSPWTKKTPCYY
jgi:serine/threonine protein kinase